MNANFIRILCVEDNTDDAVLIVDEFERAGYAVEYKRVASAPNLRAALNEKWDLVTCDHVMPSFNSREALKILQATGSDTPFILVSGSIGEREAAEMMRLGVNDYVLKDSLDRLVVSAERELREAENRRQKKTALAQLEKSEHEFRTIFEVATVGVVQTLACTSQILRVNNRMCELSGFSEEELVAQDLLSLAHPEDRPKKIEVLARLQTEAPKSYTLEMRMKHKNGGIWWGLETASVLKGSDGGADRILAVIIDITELKKLEATQASAIEARDRFLSIASHELKTPLTSLKLQVQIFERQIVKGDAGYLSREKILGLLRDVARQTVALTRLVDDMLDVSRIHTGKLSFRFESCDLRELVTATVERLKPHIEQSDSRLWYEADGPVLGCWDQHRMEQVVANLLTNAARYGNGKPIHVRLWREGDTAQLAVRDHGLGIPAEDQDRIFKQFERAVRENEVSGLGLGLFIAKRIVQAHGGQITVSSKPNEGSMFVVSLPIVRFERSI